MLRTRLNVYTTGAVGIYACGDMSFIGNSAQETQAYWVAHVDCIMGRYGTNNTINEETWRVAEEAFVTGNLTLAELSNRSKEIAGQHIGFERLRFIAMQNDWNARRLAWREKNGKPETDIAAEVDSVREMLYQQIYLSGKDGLTLTGDFDKEVVKSLLKNVEGLQVIEGRRGGVDPQIVNAYINLLSKSNYDLKIGDRSAKTPLQKAQDIVRAALEKQQSP